MKTLNLILAATMISLLAGCSTAPQVTERVGPAPAKVGGYVGEGWLVVRTATETYEIGDNTFYHPHTGYSIYTSAGQLWKYISNQTDHTDETAALVRIPAGNYNIHADSDFGPVIVPVLVATDKTTEVNLDTAGMKGSRHTNDTSVVWLPKGKSRAYYQIGWRAESAINNE